MALALITLDFFQLAFDGGVVVLKEPGKEFPGVNASYMRVRASVFAVTFPQRSRTMALGLITFDFLQSAFESVGVVVEKEPGEEFHGVNGG